MNKYKDIGLKRTPQRLAIIEYLYDNFDHPTVDDIYADIRVKFPTMSLATVYKTLETLKEKGYLKELTIDKERKHFDPDTTRHYHLICIKCKKIVDVNKEFSIKIPIGDHNNFEVIDTNIEFYGICPVCKKRRT
ncbi:peroxide operon regulator [bacterium BMS3Bbin09]|nr:peroxide operon regulator [bacterium BMS3Bbin09]